MPSAPPPPVLSRARSFRTGRRPPLPPQRSSRQRRRGRKPSTSRIGSPLLQSDAPGSADYRELNAVSCVKGGVAGLQDRDNAERSQHLKCQVIRQFLAFVGFSNWQLRTTTK